MWVTIDFNGYGHNMYNRGIPFNYIIMQICTDCNTEKPLTEQTSGINLEIEHLDGWEWKS
jgi:hypothetical protein